jgi:hypothetical protein
MEPLRDEAPKFPLRVIFDDGDSITIEGPEELFDLPQPFDSADPETGVIVRDDDDRNVRLAMAGGEIVHLAAVE